MENFIIAPLTAINEALLFVNKTIQSLNYPLRRYNAICDARENDVKWQEIKDKLTEEGQDEYFRQQCEMIPTISPRYKGDMYKGISKTAANIIGAGEMIGLFELNNYGTMEKIADWQREF